MGMCSYFAVISMLPWTMVFCNTNECDADQDFLRAYPNRACSLVTIAVQRRAVCGYLSEKVTYWLFKIFEIQKGRTFSFNDILRLCTIVVNIAIRIRA